jgi:imidazolonepropionase-like amidohydrolase
MTNKTHYIKTGWLIDGSGAPVRKKVLLTVKNGIIADISSFRDDDCPDSALLTDLSRCTILPPLVDCHVHLAMSGSTDAQARQQQLTATSYEECKARIADHLHYHFSYGVLAVRDGGDRFGHVLRYKKEKETESNKKRNPVIVKSPGAAWHQNGRYGAFIGRAPVEGNGLEIAVAEHIDSVDHVKLINSGLNSLTEFAKETDPQFSLEDLQAIVDLAKQKGKKVMVHANGRVPVRLALEAGCHSIEHGFFMGDENLKRMAENLTVWVPTAVTMKAALDNWDLISDGKNKKAVIARNLEHQLEQMAKAHQYGVRLALGTDAGCSGVLHGESVVEELKLFMKAGYSLVEAIACASSNGAQLLGLDAIGTIAKGRPAHFIVARATPAMLPRKLSYLEAIYLDGRPCDKAFFNKI